MGSTSIQQPAVLQWLPWQESERRRPGHLGVHVETRFLDFSAFRDIKIQRNSYMQVTFITPGIKTLLYLTR